MGVEAQPLHASRLGSERLIESPRFDNQEMKQVPGTAVGVGIAILLAQCGTSCVKGGVVGIGGGALGKA